MLKVTTCITPVHHTVNHYWTMQSPLAFKNSFIFIFMEKTEVGTGLRQKYVYNEQYLNEML